jgi:hypothetical protein
MNKSTTDFRKSRTESKQVRSVPIFYGDKVTSPPVRSRWPPTLINGSRRSGKLQLSCNGPVLLKVLLDRVRLYSTCKLGPTCGDHPGAKFAGNVHLNAAIKEQLHATGASQIDVFADDGFEKLRRPDAQRHRCGYTPSATAPGRGDSPLYDLQQSKAKADFAPSARRDSSVEWVRGSGRFGQPSGILTREKAVIQVFVADCSFCSCRLAHSWPLQHMRTGKGK